MVTDCTSAMHGRVVKAPPWAAPQLGSCASSGRASWRWAARHSQEELRPTGRASRLRRRRFHLLRLPCRQDGCCKSQDSCGSEWEPVCGKLPSTSQVGGEVTTNYTHNYTFISVRRG